MMASKRKKTMKGRISVQPVLLLILLAIPGAVVSENSSKATTLSPTSAADLTTNTTTTSSVHGICSGDIDIRNQVSLFKRLENCSIIDGYLQIVLIEHANETDFEDLSFPDLREITSYLLFYRVAGLRSIGKLFPNLALIRGNSLFQDYAFVIFDMFHLEEVGLSRLAEISRGGVRIEKNPSLCFLDTINWELIAKWDLEKNFVAISKQPAECPTSAVCRQAGCPLDLCWNSEFCQIPSNKTYNNCDPQCLGGCSGPGPMACHSCRNYLTLNNECVQICPNNTYLLLNRRCVSKKYCFGLKDSSNEITKNLHYVIFNGSCISNCPSGYEMTTNKDTCKICPKGQCKKICPGFNIVSIAGAQNLRGCTFINGSLEISIRYGKHKTIAHELEESFKLIEEIRGCLKISRSFPLVNLKFFRSLEIIRGEKDLLENGKYSLIVLDNQNLQELWDIKSTFRIKNGRLFFHFNPKLCHHYIETLIAGSNITNITTYEIDQESNGDKFACNTTRVDLTFTEITSKSVLINIVLPNSTSPRPSMHRFAVHFTESESTNLTMYQEETNECVESMWRVRDIILESGQYITTTQTHLQPFTQYAFYVKTYSVHSTIGESPIYYVRTRPSKPSEITLTLGYSNESSTIVLEWEPPRHPNGILSEYIVTGFLQKDDRILLDQRDYCKHPMEEEPPEDLPTDLLTNVENETETCCYENQITYKPKGEFGTLCDNSREGLLPMDLYNEDSSITCNKYFYESIYESPLVTDDPKKLMQDIGTATKSKFKKRENPTKRHAGEDKQKLPGKQFADTHWNQDFSFTEMARNDSKGYVINKLHHFSKYTVMVRVCREKFMDEEDNDYEKRCSKHEIVTVRTLKKDDADIIDNNGIRVTNEDDNIVMISWEEPADPNGIVVSFQIEHKQSDLENAKAITECVTHENYIKNGKRYYLRGLNPGKYVYRLRTVSLAGPGPFSDPFEFEVEASKHGYYYTLMILFTVVILLVGTGGFYYIMVRKKPTIDLDKLLASSNSEHSLSSPPDIEDSWEIERENVQIVKEIGKGSFGKVYEGVLHPEKISCAVKTVTDIDHTSAFWNEITVMKRAAGVPHIVQLLGIISQASPPVVVMELLALGDLKSFLRSTRAAPPLRPALLRMAAQIADAMVFMEMNRFLHRDLAARNCLVHEDHTVKVGDFGLTRDVYTTDYYKKGDKGLLPIRWMAPESLRDGVFTSRSDVWSYGVVLWEIATLAEQPYQGLSNEQVLQDVIDGKTLVPPESCSELFKVTMTLCWSKNPALRPSFRRVMSKLEKNIDAVFKCTSYYHTTVVAGESNTDDIVICEPDEPQVSLIL